MGGRALHRRDRDLPCGHLCARHLRAPAPPRLGERGPLLRARHRRQGVERGRRARGPAGAGGRLRPVRRGHLRGRRPARPRGALVDADRPLGGAAAHRRDPRRRRFLPRAVPARGPEREDRRDRHPPRRGRPDRRGPARPRRSPARGRGDHLRRRAGPGARGPDHPRRRDHRHRRGRHRHPPGHRLPCRPPELRPGPHRAGHRL
ncbi:Basic proline-rich protein precursor [Brachybacterium faecium]|nr:Basic proline-rich protein precursor [Brachybacterium faecium]